MKQLAEGMGGTVEASSDPGRLTRFVVRLRRPVERVPELAHSPAAIYARPVRRTEG